jgi:hypothetical protein
MNEPNVVGAPAQARSGESKQAPPDPEQSDTDSSVLFRTRFWTFLNSAFGLWLLSAALLTGGGATFTRWQAKASDEQSSRERIERLDLEISSRFSQVLVRLYHLTDRDKHRQRLMPGNGVTDVRAAIQLLLSPIETSGVIMSLYPEFKTYSLATLMAELQRLLRNETDRTKVGVALAALTGETVMDADMSDPINGAGAILDIMLPRWKGSYFHFTDCSSVDPFC